MHITKRPEADIRIPMQWEEEDTTLADLAYFNSAMCKTILRFYSQPALICELGRKKGRTPVVRPERFIDTTEK
jgi:hypothetical protein